MKIGVRTVLLLTLWLVGCSEEGVEAATPVDGGALPDVAIDAPSDTGMPDTSVGPDSADTLLSGEDASDAEDTSTVKDTVPFEDTSRPEDTGLQRDTAALADTIEPMDTRVSPDTSVPEDTTASSDTAPPADTTPGCVLHSDCDQSDRCIKALCVEGLCVDETASCADLEPCTIESTCDLSLGCENPFEVSAECSAYTALFAEGFDDGTSGLMSVSEATGAPGAVSWGPDPSQTYTGSGALYLGIPGPYNFDGGTVVVAAVSTPMLTLPAEATIALRFGLWMDVEAGPDWDVLSVRAVTDQGNVPLWAKDSQNVVMSNWQVVSVDLSAYAGTSISIVFEFHSLDETFNEGVGVFLDAVRVLTAEGAKPCQEAADCEDGNTCTEESCVDGFCAYQAGPSCCLSDADCGDSDVCTLDLCGSDSQCEYTPVADPECCNAGDLCDDGNQCTVDACGSASQCTHVVDLALEGCCAADGDCEDSDSCTVDTCASYQCQHNDVCCAGDSECNDLDACTSDTCVSGACVFQLLTTPGCCTPVLLEESFDQVTVLGEEWQTTATGTTCSWSVVNDGKSKSGPGALYFGNALLKNAECGPGGGATVLTPPIQVPDKPGPVLTFDLYPSLSVPLDVIDVSIVTESQSLLPLLNSLQLGPQDTWAEHSFSLEEVKGQVIRIQFLAAVSTLGLPPFGFTTPEGVYVDNLRVTDTCE